MMQNNEIRALCDETTITVYQAYSNSIAVAAVKNQKFVPPFKLDRMTWIKPSFLWMMYRSGWATKTGQEHILAIRITHEGFNWALNYACLTHFDSKIYKSHQDWRDKLSSTPVRIQWDPERNILLEPLPFKAIQIGLSGIAVEKYIHEWIVSIEDITPQCKKIHSMILENQNQAQSLLPIEKLYPF